MIEKLFFGKYKKQIEELEHRLHVSQLHLKSYIDVTEKLRGLIYPVNSVKGYKVAAIYFPPNSAYPRSIIYDSANEAAISNKIDGSNLTKKLKDNGGNCVIKGIQFILVRI